MFILIDNTFFTQYKYYKWTRLYSKYTNNAFNIVYAHMHVAQWIPLSQTIQNVVIPHETPPNTTKPENFK